MNFLSRLAERLTTQELNLKKIHCEERVVVERIPLKDGAPQQLTQNFIMTGETQSRGQFSSDIVFVETHVPVDSNSSMPTGAVPRIDDSMLVKDSFSAASEFLGMSHREIYVQRFLGKEKLQDFEAFVLAFQTVNKLESRKIMLDGKPTPMRVVGTAWIDAHHGTLRRLEVRQTKLPKSIREFSYNLQYPPSPSGLILPTTVQFKRQLNEETIITTQSFFKCQVN